MRYTHLLVIAGVVAAPSALVAQSDATAKVLAVEDYFDLEQVSDPQIAPDGSRIVYTRRWVNTLEDRWESDLWIMGADGSRNRFLVKGANARWSPDGTRILYLAPGEPRGAQLHVRWMDAEGATSQITHVAETPQSPVWSPDGRSIAFAAVVPAKEAWDVGMPPPPEGASWTDSPRVVNRLHYRQDRFGSDGFREPGFSHLFVVTADGGTPRQLTAGEWNVGARFDDLMFGAGIDWAPDGNTIVFDGLRESDGDLSYERSHIYAIDVTGDNFRTLTSRPGYWTAPAVSPDGRRIAFLGYPASDLTYSAPDVHMMSITGDDVRNVMGDFDRPPGPLHWAADGSGVYFTAQDRGAVNVHFAPVRGGVRAVTDGAHVLGMTSIAGDADITAVGVRSDPDEAGDVVRMSLRRSDPPTRLTSVNDDLLGPKALGEVEEVWYESTSGTNVQGWIVKPPSFDPAKQYPLVMEIHGGPFAMYTVAFNFTFQAFAANDYVVLYTNPRGSTGYGEEFSRAINFAYPSVDYDDLMAGVDAVIERGYVDTTRMYVGGCSGGGVLSSWVIGHTDRFAAAAVRCPVTNWMSMAGQSDIPFFLYSFFREPFWENPDRWLEQSSIMHVGNVTTPTLLMTGEMDRRTPMPQSEEYFAALKLRGIPTRLLRFNGEFHGTSSKPTNALRTMLYMMNWYGQHRRATQDVSDAGASR